MIGIWVHKGLCRQPGNHPEWWWPDNNEDRNASIALGICMRCPVRQQCREHALSKPEEFGIWGGMLPETRRRIRLLERERYTGPGVLGSALRARRPSEEVLAERRNQLRECN